MADLVNVTFKSIYVPSILHNPTSCEKACNHVVVYFVLSPTVIKFPFKTCGCCGSCLQAHLGNGGVHFWSALHCSLPYKDGQHGVNSELHYAMDQVSLQHRTTSVSPRAPSTHIKYMLEELETMYFLQYSFIYSISASTYCRCLFKDAKLFTQTSSITLQHPVTNVTRWQSKYSFLELKKLGIELSFQLQDPGECWLLQEHPQSIVDILCLGTC